MSRSRVRKAWHLWNGHVINKFYIGDQKWYRCSCHKKWKR